MSSAVGCPLGGAAGLVAAAGELVGTCANDGMTARVEQKRIAKEIEVFMVAVFQDDARGVKRVSNRLSVIKEQKMDRR